jgi:hypothetical protein
MQEAVACPSIGWQRRRQVREGFTKGFEIADLKDAKTLLEELLN